MFKLFKEKLKNVLSKLKKDIDEKAEEEKKILKLEEEKKEKKLKELEEKEKKLKEGIEKTCKEIENKEEKKSFFGLIKEKFTTTKLNEEDFNEIFHNLEIILLENNVAVSVIDEIKKSIKNELLNKPISKKEIDEKIKDSLKEALERILIEPFDLITKIKESKKPFVIIFFGINGSGKTTTIAKLAHLLQKNKISCVLAASDTFRAASIEQLEKHANKLRINIIKHQYGADPAAVAFDAIAHAKAAGKDVVLIDTAGRMHTKADLMKEMEKISRVAKADLKIFVGESITGNDVVEQAMAFNKSIGIDAIILTKADIDEKGGAMISVSKVTGKPILYIGTGQNYDDLEIFDKNKIINSIFN
ncbi:MAG: signal recognition particle-docking protein FtsY [Candidatus Pacearchaeota archaeon]